MLGTESVRACSQVTRRSLSAWGASHANAALAVASRAHPPLLLELHKHGGVKSAVTVVDRAREVSSSSLCGEGRPRLLASGRGGAGPEASAGLVLFAGSPGLACRRSGLSFPLLIKTNNHRAGFWWLNLERGSGAVVSVGLGAAGPGAQEHRQGQGHGTVTPHEHFRDKFVEIPHAAEGPPANPCLGDGGTRDVGASCLLGCLPRPHLGRYMDVLSSNAGELSGGKPNAKLSSVMEWLLCSKSTENVC